MPSASDFFGGIAGSYDSLIERAVPRYHEMIDTLVDYLPIDADRILELGCGTGNLSVRLAARYPASAITYVDAAPEMIDVTRQRIGVEAPRTLDRATFDVRRFEELELDGEEYDLVVSSISLHHVAGKRDLYRRIAVGTGSGGRFCFADQIRGMPERNHRLNWDRWLAFCRRPGGCSEEEIRSLLDHADAHDHYTPLEEHFELLSASGFVSLDCVWRNLIWGIVTAERRV